MCLNFSRLFLRSQVKVDFSEIVMTERNSLEILLYNRGHFLDPSCEYRCRRREYLINDRNVFGRISGSNFGIFLQEATEDSLKAEKRKLQREVCFSNLTRLFVGHTVGCFCLIRNYLRPS